jgi:hypothetical protein
MDCVIKEATENELHPNNMNKSKQVMETSHLVPRGLQEAPRALRWTMIPVRLRGSSYAQQPWPMAFTTTSGLLPAWLQSNFPTYLLPTTSLYLFSQTGPFAVLWPPAYTCFLKPALAHSYLALPIGSPSEPGEEGQQAIESRRNPLPLTLQTQYNW